MLWAGPTPKVDPAAVNAARMIIQPGSIWANVGPQAAGQWEESFTKAAINTYNRWQDKDDFQIPVNDLNEIYRKETEQYGFAFDRPMSSTEAKRVVDRHRMLWERDDIMERSSFLGKLIGYGSMIGAGIFADPLATAVGMALPITAIGKSIPLIGNLVAKTRPYNVLLPKKSLIPGAIAAAPIIIANPIAQRLKAQAALSAIDGAFGNLLVTPAVAYDHNLDYIDYGMAEALADVTFGTIMGGVIGAGSVGVKHILGLNKIPTGKMYNSEIPLPSYPVSDTLTPNAPVASMTQEAPVPVLDTLIPEAPVPEAPTPEPEVSQYPATLVEQVKNTPIVAAQVTPPIAVEAPKKINWEQIINDTDKSILNYYGINADDERKMSVFYDELHSHKIPSMPGLYNYLGKLYVEGVELDFDKEMGNYIEFYDKITKLTWGDLFDTIFMDDGDMTEAGIRQALKDLGVPELDIHAGYDIYNGIWETLNGSDSASAEKTLTDSVTEIMSALDGDTHETLFYNTLNTLADGKNPIPAANLSVGNALPMQYGGPSKAKYDANIQGALDAVKWWDDLPTSVQEAITFASDPEAFVEFSKKVAINKIEPVAPGDNLLKGISAWTNGSMGLQSYLSAGAPITSTVNVDNMMEKVNEWIKQGPVRDAFITYRYVGFKEAEFYRNTAIGDIHVNRPFMATTEKKSGVEQQANYRNKGGTGMVVEIHMPAFKEGQVWGRVVDYGALTNANLIGGLQTEKETILAQNLVIEIKSKRTAIIAGKETDIVEAHVLGKVPDGYFTIPNDPGDPSTYYGVNKGNIKLLDDFTDTLLKATGINATSDLAPETKLKKNKIMPQDLAPNKEVNSIEAKIKQEELLAQPPILPVEKTPDGTSAPIKLPEPKESAAKKAKEKKAISEPEENAVFDPMTKGLKTETLQELLDVNLETVELMYNEVLDFDPELKEKLKKTPGGPQAVKSKLFFDLIEESEYTPKDKNTLVQWYMKSLGCIQGGNG